MGESSRSQVFREGLLEGLVCVVSGAGSGVGREAALELTRLGAVVVGCGRRAEPLAQTAELAQGAPGSFEHEPLDIREEEPVGAFFDRLLERHGRLDVLVNNAGGQFLAPAESISPKGFRTVIELNVQGTWQMTHAAATKAFIPQGGGKVMSVTLSPHNGMPGMVHSGAARAAVENMMRTLAIEWSRFGIKTCSLAMGHFATDVVRTKYPPRGGRELRPADPARPRRQGRGDGLADRLPRLARRRLLLGDDDHDRRRPRRLGRALAAAVDRDRGRWRGRRAAPPEGLSAPRRRPRRAQATGARGTGGAQVYIPPNMPPVTLSTWPWT